MTQQEKAFWNLLPEELQQISTVTMSYQNYWAIINKNLRTIYGDRVEWEKCISAYQKSHIVRKCEDIPLVTTDEIRNMLAKDEKDRVTSAKLVEMLPLISSNDRCITCQTPAKKYKLYKSSINKSLHFVQRSLSSSTRVQRVTAQLNLSRE